MVVQPVVEIFGQCTNIVPVRGPVSLLVPHCTQCLRRFELCDEAGLAKLRAFGFVVILPRDASIILQVFGIRSVQLSWSFFGVKFRRLCLFHQPRRTARSRCLGERRCCRSGGPHSPGIGPDLSPPAARGSFSQIHTVGRPYYRFSTCTTGIYKKGARKIPSKRTQNPDKRRFMSTYGPVEISVFHRSFEQRT